MLQAEVGGGGRVDPEEGLQKPGYLIRDFVLMSAQGGRVQVSDYRGRSNLVLVFTGQAGAECDFLRDAAGRYQDFTEQDAVVVAVFPSNSQETHAPPTHTTGTWFSSGRRSSPRSSATHPTCDTGCRPTPCWSLLA